MNHGKVLSYGASLWVALCLCVRIRIYGPLKLPVVAEGRRCWPEHYDRHVLSRLVLLLGVSGGFFVSMPMPFGVTHPFDSATAVRLRDQYLS